MTEQQMQDAITGLQGRIAWLENRVAILEQRPYQSFAPDWMYWKDEAAAVGSVSSMTLSARMV